MFIVLLKFAKNRELSKSYMESHMKWLQQGFADGIFFLSGSIKPNLGGAIFANNTSLSELTDRVNSDPFVTEKIVTAEIVEIAPNKVDDRLNFLLKD